MALHPGSTDVHAGSYQQSVDPSIAGVPAGTLWLDTTGVPGVWRVRNPANSAWNLLGPLYSFADPGLQTFAWVNQGGATVNATHGPTVLIAPKAAGDNIRIRKKAIPALPYSITIAMRQPVLIAPNLNAGFCWRESGTGKLVTVGIHQLSNIPLLAVSIWTNPTTFVSNYVTVNLTATQITWLKMQDDNTSRIVSISPDGWNWMQVHSVSRTADMTADEVGFFANSSQATYDGILVLYSWAEA